MVQELEITILGTFFSYPYTISIGLELLKTEYFSLMKHKNIFDAMVQMFNDGKEIDRVSIAEISGENYNYIQGLSYNKDISIEVHCKLLIEYWMKRELDSLADEIKKSEDDVFELSQEVQSKIFNITQRVNKKEIHIKDSIDKLLNEIDSIQNSGVNTSLVKTNFYALDDKLGGLKNGELYILAARPSIGKTSLAFKFASNIAEKYPVFFVSLEMSHLALSTRMVSIKAQIPFSKILSGHLTKEESNKIISASSRIKKLDLCIDDKAAQNIIEIRSKALRLKAEKDIKLIVVDYLQLAHAKADNREREISIISQSLKSIAKDLNIPVIGLSQLNRLVETRPTKKPQLSDLRESGSIEQDADVVMLLHRPEYYGLEKFEDGSSTTNKAEIIIAKNRNGGTGTIRIAFTKEYADFNPLTEREPDII
ncbi:MAG: replicative DNA helicase [Ignavibacteriales bacterium]|nr:replicative DNA helicase [Ignavibacteriales bacterium]